MAKDVDIRHFVLTPLHQKCSFSTAPDLVKNEYCNWGRDLFNSFTHIDHQTVLNDDDGTLTGYKGTTIINLDEFFHAPVQAIQCQSDMTSVTSPYQYVTTVVYPNNAGMTERSRPRGNGARPARREAEKIGLGFEPSEGAPRWFTASP